MYSFGFPKNCNSCNNVVKLIPPFFKDGGSFRLMIIGQDPTIRKNPGRVKTALMLDEENSQLRRWLTQVIGKENFNKATIYATNLVKCRLNNLPSGNGGLGYIKPFFDNCKDYLVEEITIFKPSLVMTLGESTHILFRTLLNNTNIPLSMQDAFTGRFVKVSIKNVEFDYTPCLHIQTFRVAETYGDRVKSFKTGLLDYFNRS